MKKKLILYSFMLLIVIGLGFGYWMWNKPQAKVEDATSLAITVDKLCQDFTADETVANKQYLNKAIEVKGKISEVSHNLDGGTMVVLTSSNGSDDVECAIREKDHVVQQGQQVTVKGFCTGKTISGVSLTDCIYVK